MRSTWLSCPGCGLKLPGNPGDVSSRPGASAACWRLYGEVAGYESRHLALLGRFHQLMVDAYAAQHPGSESSGIGLAFALIGLHLALDHGWRGDQVRDAHQALATMRRAWPRFDPPEHRGSMTVFDVAMAAAPEAHVELVQAWAADVWQAWGHQRSGVIALLSDRLPAAELARINRR